MDATEILRDDTFTVPPVPTGTSADRGVAWLRAHVARFSEGEQHRRRRALVARLLDRVDPQSLRRPGDHVAVLVRALGLPGAVGRDVRLVASAYQPHRPVTSEADDALERLVAACGGRGAGHDVTQDEERDERTAALIGLLVQACHATAALVAGDEPPVPTTSRIAPDGRAVEVPLDAVPFGAGRHACPGREHALALADGSTAFHRLHEGPDPLVLPNAWDVASAAALVRAGFTAVGTTSLGVAASRGLPDAAGASRDATVELARRLVDLPVPVTVDVEAGFDDPGGLARELWEAGVAGVNVEDGRGRALADLAEHAAVVAAMKHGAPGLFVNARTDTHWLGVDHARTLERARAYVDSGADGVFVPGLQDEGAIAALAEALPVPLNVLAHSTASRLGELGVRRISTGSLLYRRALAAAVDAARVVRAGGPVADLASASTPYVEVEGLLTVRRG